MRATPRDACKSENMPLMGVFSPGDSEKEADHALSADALGLPATAATRFCSSCLCSGKRRGSRNTKQMQHCDQRLVKMHLPGVEDS